MTATDGTTAEAYEPPSIARPVGAGALDARGLGQLTTEAVRPELEHLDLLSPADLVSLLAADARRATDAVVGAAAAITAAVEMAYQRLSAGGRLVYVGAGTAGRLAVLDAAELGPTFSVPEGRAVAVIAGGDDALRHPVEGAEDDRAAGAAAMEALDVTAADVLIGVSASGRTPYVVGAVEWARSRGAATIGLSCNRGTPLAAAADVAIEVVVGGEVVAGSSRLNAGTAQKITLNTISTAVMVLLGKTYGNLMVDVRATNTKLRDRAVRIVDLVTGVGTERAFAALEAAGWSAKLAALVAASGQDAAAAQSALDAAHGRLRPALALAGAGPVGSDGSGTSRGATPGPAAARRWRRLGVGHALVGGALVPGDVAVHDGRVVAVGLPGAGPGLAVPGFVDLQVNGYAGIDVARASIEDLVSMNRALVRVGVLAYQPTLISGDPTVTCMAAGRVTKAMGGQDRERGPERGARILGVHLEGPFLSPHRAGAHPLDRLRSPDMALAQRLVSSGQVTMMTLAPELPGALDLISWLTGQGIVVSLGHSAASAQQVSRALSAGASVATHLFNGMTPISARDPGLGGVALSDERVRVQLIADGGHVADELLRLAFAAARDRCSIVTDATSLSGGGERQLSLGDVPIELSDGVARRPDGTIAGGASTLLQAVHRLASLSLGLADVLSAATERPARILGRQEIGHLYLDGPANLVVLDDRLALRQVLIGGEPVDLSSP